MNNLSEIESRIVELCERARDELKWKFGPCTFSSDSEFCGCVLEASAVVLGMNKSAWQDVAADLGLYEEGALFGGHFDHLARPGSGGAKVTARNEEEELAERLARRFVEGVE